MNRLLRIAGAILPALLMPTAPVHSAVTATQTVTLVGAVLNTCVLTVTTPGVLSPLSTGTQLASDTVGGAPAVLAVASTGARPTLGFSAPTVAGPVGSGSSTAAIAYTSTSGANQTFTTGASSAQSSALLDVYTINAHVDNSTGFPTGTYTVSSTVTCQQ